MTTVFIILFTLIAGLLIVKLYRRTMLGKNYPVPRRNFPVYVGRNRRGIKPGTYYVSRSCAAEAVVLCKKSGVWHVLANKRGPGCFNNAGLWNVPSGYVDTDETCEQTAVRETFEETGVSIYERKLKLYCIDSAPVDRQNIVAVYYTVLNREELPRTSDEYSEEGEISEIKWIPETEFDYYRWISENHIGRVKEIIKLLDKDSDPNK